MCPRDVGSFLPENSRMCRWNTSVCRRGVRFLQEALEELPLVLPACRVTVHGFGVGGTLGESLESLRAYGDLPILVHLLQSCYNALYADSRISAYLPSVVHVLLLLLAFYSNLENQSPTYCTIAGGHLGFNLQIFFLTWTLFFDLGDLIADLAV